MYLFLFSDLRSTSSQNVISETQNKISFVVWDLCQYSCQIVQNTHSFFYLSVHVKHEAVKAEMAGKQRELDQFSSKGKQLLSELKKIPDCDSQMMKKDMETLVDQWLDVSLRADLCFSILHVFGFV